MTAPPLAYFGGKTTLAPRLAALLPAHEHYIEPFCGGLSVLLAKRPSTMETANDLDGRLMTFWRVLRNRTADLEAYVDRMATVAARLAHVSLECRPALDLVEQFGQVDRGVLMYIDPPYLGSTRSGRNYLIEMSSQAERLELCRALRASRAAVVVSGYDSELYAEELAGWHRTTFHATTNGDSSGARAARTEVVWSNRPLEVAPGLWDDQ